MAGWATGPLGEQRFPIGRALQAGVCAGAGGLRAHLEEKEVTARRAEVHEAATRDGGRRRAELQGWVAGGYQLTNVEEVNKQCSERHEII